MLAGIIRDKENDYYIHLNNINDKDVLDIIKISGFNEVHLSKKEIYDLFIDTFSSKMKFLRKTNDYDIYLDEAGNERFFHGGKENYKLLFLKNGHSLVRNIKKLYKEVYDDEVLECTFLTSKKIRRFMISISALCILLDGVFIYVDGDYEALFSKVYNQFNGLLSVDKITDLVSDSSLSDNSKNVILNYDLLNDVILYSLNSENESYTKDDIILRNYELYQKFNGLEIKKFSLLNVEAAGYYSPTNPNKIYLLDEINKEKYNDILAHEYAHLLQVPTSYEYLCEASAELISSEYYNTIPDGYKEEVKRLKILMEIIGPEPVLNFNFKREDTSLKESISMYLNESETNELFNQFLSTPNQWGNKENEELINQKIDNLLSKMYFNKTGEDIKTNEIINLIYKGNNEKDIDAKRIYFNKNHENYYDDFCVRETVENTNNDISIEEAVNSNKFLGCNYFKLAQYGEEYADDFNVENQLWKKVMYIPKGNVNILEKDDLTLIEKDGVNYEPLDALSKGLLTKKSVICTCDKLPYFDYITGRVCEYIEVEFNDGNFIKYKYNSSTNTYDYVESYKVNKEYYPSIDKLFSKDSRKRSL